MDSADGDPDQRAMEREQTGSDEAQPESSQVYSYLMFGLSLPERALRATELGNELLNEADSRIDAPNRDPEGDQDGSLKGADLSAEVAALQRKISEAVIPVVVRHRLRDKLAELQRIAKAQAKRQSAKTGRSAMEQVAADKLREVQAGHDGTWVAHPGLVPIAREIFDAHMPAPNQISKLREEVRVTASDLLAVPAGQITEEGVRELQKTLPFCKVEVEY